MTTHQAKTTMDEGTLLQCVLTLVENDLNPSLEKDVGHIVKWSQTIARGHDMFTRDLLWDRSRVKPKPVAFAVMANGEAIVQVAHGFGHLALEQEGHPSEGLFGCFLGDRTVLTLNDETSISHVHDIIQGVQKRLSGFPNHTDICHVKGHQDRKKPSYAQLSPDAQINVSTTTDRAKLDFSPHGSLAPALHCI